MALPILIDPNLDMIAIIVLIVVVLQSVVNYLAVRSRYALYVVVGFSFLLLSHVFAIPAEVDLRGYGLSQVFQFLGYIALLVMLVRAGREA
jgi:asparagine N-glycosylation enzyme membrane subunit Stt3